jgi:O-Antigen ligase
MARIPAGGPRSGTGEARHRVLRYLGTTTYVSLLVFYLADGFLPQIQMPLTGGTTPINSQFKLILLLLAVASILITRCVYKSSIAIATFVLAAYMAIDFLVLLQITDYRAPDLFNSFRGCLIPIVLCGLIVSAPLQVAERKVLAWGAAMFTAAVVVSSLQFMTGTSVLPTQSQDGGFVVQSPVFFGHMRAFSIFSSGYQAGLFYCIPAAAGAILILTRRKRAAGALLLCLGIFGSYATLTRLTMLALGASVLSVAVLVKPRWSRQAVLLPLLSVLIAIVTISMTSSASGDSAKPGISSNESVGERLHEWGFYTDTYLSSDIAKILFGSGMSEYASSDAPKKYPSSAPRPIDNAPLQLLLHGGLFSCGIVIYYYIQAWRMLLSKATNERSLFSLGAAAVFSTTPLVATFNDLPVAMFALFAIAMMTKREVSTPSAAGIELTAPSHAYSC